MLIAAAGGHAGYLADARDAQPIAAGRAVNFFRTVCVQPLPSAERFVAAMNDVGVRWTRVSRSREEVAVNGNSWRSSIGEVAYNHQSPFAKIIRAGAACHFAFRTDPRYAHDQVSAQIASVFQLGEGRNVGSRKEPQTQWETKPASGKYLRFFLTTRASAPGGPQALLSVSERLGE
jgi:hypothetical protein